jgi:Ser/Thr protein kinase RdoA (MazF antagonist)
VIERELFHGGMNAVERVGGTVRRPVGPWTPTVHALLRHLERVGFEGAPRSLYVDDDREILTFIRGTVGDGTLTAAMRSESALASVGQLLRRLHDATSDFVPPPDAVWQLSPRAPADVICHGDAAPYNCVFDGDRVVALIDWDTAHPGPRIWDVGYTAYRFVLQARPPDDERDRRLGILAQAYGNLEAADLVGAAIDRLGALIELIETEAARGHPAFSQHLADGHAEHYRADLAWLAQLGRPGRSDA